MATLSQPCSLAAWRAREIKSVSNTHTDIPDRQNHLRELEADYERLCHDVQPGGGRILTCLSASAEKLSPACRSALPDAQALASRATATGVMPK